MKSFLFVLFIPLCLGFKTLNLKVVAVRYKSSLNQTILYDPLDKEVLKKRPVVFENLQFVYFKDRPLIQLWETDKKGKASLSSSFVINIIDATGVLVCEHTSSGGVKSPVLIEFKKIKEDIWIVVNYTNISQKQIFEVDEIANIVKE